MADFLSNSGRLLCQCGLWHGGSKQVFIQGKYVDKHLDGTYSLFIKRTDYFPISGQASPTKNRFVSGATLIKRLSLYNE